MPETIDTTAWSAMLLGLYTLFAGIGALRQPGFYRNLIAEVSQSSALQLTTALLELLFGSLVYLANPWVPADILACVTKFIGGCMMIEALAIAGFCDVYSAFWLKNLSYEPRIWSIFAVLMGLGLTIPAILRFS